MPRAQGKAQKTPPAPGQVPAHQGEAPLFYLCESFFKSLLLQFFPYIKQE